MATTRAFQAWVKSSILLSRTNLKSSAEEYGYFHWNEKPTVFVYCLEYATLGDR